MTHYPERDADTIAAATHVPREFVLRYLDGRTHEEAARAEPVTPPRCIRCGEAAAEVGPHCKRCAIAVRNEVQAAAAAEPAVARKPPPADAPARGVVTERRAREAGGRPGAFRAR